MRILGQLALCGLVVVACATTPAEVLDEVEAPDSGGSVDAAGPRVEPDPPEAGASPLDAASLAPGYDIVLIAGQSNASNGGMNPTGDDLAGPLDAAIEQLTCNDVDRNKILDAEETAELVPATDQLRDCFFNVSDVIDAGRHGFGMAFARAYAHERLASDRKVLLVPGGYPSTSASDWADGPLLENLLLRAQSALALPGENRVVAILWRQGEWEIQTLGAQVAAGQGRIEEYEGEYEERLRRIIGRTREALSPELPFLLSEKSPQWDTYPGFKLQFEEIDRRVAADVGHSTVISAAGLAGNPTLAEAAASGLRGEDARHIHFSASSNVQLGRRFFTALDAMP